MKGPHQLKITIYIECITVTGSFPKVHMIDHLHVYNDINNLHIIIHPPIITSIFIDDARLVNHQNHITVI